MSSYVTFSSVGRKDDYGKPKILKFPVLTPFAAGFNTKNAAVAPPLLRNLSPVDSRRDLCYSLSVKSVDEDNGKP